MATRRKKRPLRGKQNIGLRAGKVLNHYKMGKHFQVQIEDDSFTYQRKQANIEKEESLDGIYVIPLLSKLALVPTAVRQG